MLVPMQGKVLLIDEGQGIQIFLEDILIVLLGFITLHI